MLNFYGLNRSFGIAVGAIALVAVISNGMALVTLNLLTTALDARGHSYEVMSELDAFRTAMLNQETGLRGYLLSGDKLSLERYRVGAVNLKEAIAALRHLIADNPDVIKRLATAEEAARSWQTTIGEHAIADMVDPATRGQAAEIESSGEGRRHFDQFEGIAQQSKPAKNSSSSRVRLTRNGHDG